jgi:hypothetical protein
MSVQMIELEEVQIVETSDEFLEGTVTGVRVYTPDSICMV